MGERHGSWGRILRVDLTSRTTSVEEMDEATFRRNPGGRAMIAHYLLKELPTGADPLGPENILVFAMGVLTGTPLSGASRHAVGAKSPLTDAFGEAEVGGFWGAELKRAGWDGIVVKGAKDLPLADPPKVKEIGRWVADTLQENHWAFHNFGTGMGLDGYTKVGGMAVRNYEGGPFDRAAEISAEALVETGYRIKMEACWACTVRCKKVVKLEQPYQIDPKYGGPEFESIAAMGSDCGIGDLAVVAKANERCNALGIDTISFGATVAWAMDLHRRGILPDAQIDGVPLEFGSGRALLVALEAIAQRHALGDVLAEGSARAAERLGGKEFLTTVKGLEIAMHDPRQRTEYGKQVRISYATSPSGGDHLNANLPSRSARNTVGMCFFLKYDDPKLTDIVNAVTGWGLGTDELTAIGERSLSLARLFNIREGFGAADDTLPPHVMKPHATGPLSKVRLGPDDLAGQIRAYYAARGWNDQGVPLPETLSRLQIAEYA